MIVIIDKHDFLPDLTGNLHYISWTPKESTCETGYTRLEYADFILRAALHGDDPTVFYRSVDSDSETGTLYPRANISLIPKGALLNSEVYRNLVLAFMLQSRLVRGEYVVFDMRNYYFFDYHTSRYDTKRYLEMIYHSHSVCKNGNDNIYVVLREIDFELPYYCRYADRNEIRKLEADKYPC